MESVLRADPKFTISSVQLLNRVWLFVTPWTAAQLLPCPSPTPRACSNSCPSSRWCHSLYPSDIYTIQDSISLFLSPNTIDHREYYQKRSSTTKNIKKGPDEMSKSSRGHDLHIRVDDPQTRGYSQLQKFCPRSEGSEPHGRLPSLWVLRREDQPPGRLALGSQRVVGDGDCSSGFALNGAQSGSQGRRSLRRGLG